MRATEVEEADVYLGSTCVGRIQRTASGSTFSYDETWPGERAAPHGIAFRIPPSRRSVITRGVNLHPFFAGLLPEGLRLSALIRRVKTSPDDLLSLLVAVGAECIGDVSVVPAGDALEPPEPIIDVARVGEEDFEMLLRRCIDSGPEGLEDMSLPGVQEKVSGAMISLPVRTRSVRADYILKLNPPDRDRLVENEALFLEMARACGLATPKARLVHDRNGRSGLLVTRFDRHYEKGAATPTKVHQEDGCQFLDRYPADKYRLSAREIVEAIHELTTAPVVETLRFLELYAFSYLIGNGDLHAKNVSLWVSPTSGLVELTPAYDLLTTQAYRGLDQRMAIRLDGRDDNFRRQSFVAFGERHGVRQAATNQMLDRLITRSGPWLDRLADVGWAPPTRDRVAHCISSRRGHLA